MIHKLCRWLTGWPWRSPELAQAVFTGFFAAVGIAAVWWWTS